MLKISENETLSQYSDKFANRISIGSGLIIFLLILVFNQDKEHIAMTGVPFAFADMGIILLLIITFFTTLFSFFFSVKAWNIKAPKTMEKSWAFPVAFVGLSYTLLIAYVTEFLLFLANEAFPLLELHKYQAAGSAAIVGVIIIDRTIKNVMTLKSMSTLYMVTMLIGLGVYMTMVRIDDPLWWEVSLSYLGTHDSSADIIFNITMFLSGFMVIVWANYFVLELKIFEKFEMMRRRHRYFVHYILIALGIAISIVGLFPSRASTFSSFMHNWAAYSLGVILGILMFLIKWFFPKLPKEFYKFSWIIVGLLAITLLMAAVGYVNTVGLELIAFALGFMWLYKLASNIEVSSMQKSPESFPK